MIDQVKNQLASPRLRHSVIAVALAVVVALLTLLRPLDITFWALQAKLPGAEPSGSIVIVTDPTGASHNSVRAANGLLLRAVENLERAGASRIVINTPLRASNDPDIDRRLRSAIQAAQGRVLIAAPIDPDVYVSGLRQPNAPLFEDAAPIASSDLETDFLDFVWLVRPNHTAEGKTYPALWTVLAGRENTRSAIQPDYTLGPRDLPTIEITQLAAGNAATLTRLRGKQVVISGLGGDDRVFKAPDSSDVEVAAAHISVIAAETAMNGGGLLVSALWTVPAFGLALLLLAAAPLARRWRRAGYAVWAAMFVIAFALSTVLGHRVMLADPLMMGLAYAAVRASANYRRRHLFIDAQSRLPNFTAFRHFLESQGSLRDHVLVVVKIARLDAIFATLKSHEQGEYLRQVASRLTLGDAGANIFHDGGKYLGMVFRRSDYADLQGHLEGLRAIASQAVMVEDTPIDVAITIGVDQSLEGDVPNRISSAIAAADQAREAYRPVFIISDFQADSEEWDHSLQSRLEAALSENRISV